LIVPNPYKILMYSHDTYGLGHIRRCLAIALSLRKSPANILIITGSLLAGRFKIPGRIDFIRIPGMIKVTNEEYLPLSIKIGATEVLEIRKKIILATARAFKPDFFIVDKAPLGLKREVVETLNWLKSDCPSCTSILGLRDIMDSAASTVREWREKGIYEAMDHLYDEIWVYGCRDLYDPITEYRIPPYIASKMHFTGYIPRQIPSAEEVQSVRRSFGIADDEKLILVTTGGGGDGQPVVNAFLSAFDTNLGGIPWKTRLMVVTGPFVSKKDYEDISRRCETQGITVLKFYRCMERLIGAAQAIVSMGGYNTVCEIVSQKKPFLIVPRAVPREEQLIRAQVLCRTGYCRYIDPRELTPESLRGEILSLVDNSSTYHNRMTSFPFSALDIIRSRIQAHARETREIARRGAERDLFEEFARGNRA
jgi:predicted glycosyltransferase